MRLKHVSLMLLLASLTACHAIFDSPKEPLGMLERPDGYELAWADEFDIDGLPNPENWDYEINRNKDGWWNNEKQYYSHARLKNARVENGKLIIEAHEDGPELGAFPDWGGQAYSSARLVTREKGFWTYGYVEVRAKLPCGRGLWPAIWTLPENMESWPNDGEIDIMEYVGHDRRNFYATVHTLDRNHVNGESFGSTFYASTACGGYHTHSMLWTPDVIKVAVDGQHYYTYENDGLGYGSWPFDRPHYLIMNVAVGGWGGAKGIDPKAFPAQMHVDYVRVYQPPED